MPWNNQQGDGKGPWGQRPGGGKGPWGGGSGPQGEPPDMDRIVRNVQSRFGGLFNRPGGGLGGFGAGVFILLGLLVWVLMPGSGWYIAQADQEGVVMRFGAYNRTEPPGFHLKLPYPVETVMKPQVTRLHQIDVGFYKAGNGEQDVPDESLMLTGDENIVELGFSLTWKIKDAKNYLFNVNDPDAVLKAVSESVMREIVGKNKLQEIITTQRGEIETEARTDIQNVVDSMQAGLLITQVQMQKAQAPAGPNGKVQEAFRDVKNAAQDAETVVNQATAYANTVVPNARGQAQKILQDAQAYKEARVAEAKGEAARFDLVYDQYKKAPRVTRQRMYLETMEDVLEKSNKILVDDKGGSGVVPYLPLDQLNKQSGAKPAGGK